MVTINKIHSLLLLDFNGHSVDQWPGISCWRSWYDPMTSHMCSLEMELHEIYTKIDLDAQLYNLCNTLVSTNKISKHNKCQMLKRQHQY